MMTVHREKGNKSHIQIFHSPAAFFYWCATVVQVKTNPFCESKIEKCNLLALATVRWQTKEIRLWGAFDHESLACAIDGAKLYW